MKTKENQNCTISEIVSDKLYLFNLLNGTNYSSYFEAENSIYFRTAEIIEKLNPRELHYLTEKIENLL